MYIFGLILFGSMTKMTSCYNEFLCEVQIRDQICKDFSNGQGHMM